MPHLNAVDVTEPADFQLIPPCADPRFDHRTCDYWEDVERGSRAARPGWLDAPRAAAPPAASSSHNPFARPSENAFLAPDPPANPFSPDEDASLPENPFAPPRRDATPAESLPRKLRLLDRGRHVFGSYAKVLLVDDVPVAYSQFGPLSAYPRALRLRDLYPQLPDAPLPAVITCIATTAEARREGHARTLIAAVCDDLAQRGFAAVEAYPDLTRPEDEQSGGRPALWHAAGFITAVHDERFPVMRRELE